jgi:hypothetical protein
MSVFKTTGLLSTRFGHTDPGEQWPDYTSEFERKNADLELLGRTSGYIIASSEVRFAYNDEIFHEKSETNLVMFAEAARQPIYGGIYQDMFVVAGLDVLYEAKDKVERITV